MDIVHLPLRPLEINLHHVVETNPKVLSQFFKRPLETQSKSESIATKLQKKYEKFIDSYKINQLFHLQ